MYFPSVGEVFIENFLIQREFQGYFIIVCSFGLILLISFLSGKSLLGTIYWEPYLKSTVARYYDRSNDDIYIIIARKQFHIIN